MYERSHARQKLKNNESTFCKLRNIFPEKHSGPSFSLLLTTSVVNPLHDSIFISAYRGGHHGEAMGHWSLLVSVHFLSPVITPPVFPYSLCLSDQSSFSGAWQQMGVNMWHPLR